MASQQEVLLLQMSVDPMEEAAAVGVDTELMTGKAKEDDEGGGGRCKRRLRSKPVLMMGGCCLALA